MTKVDILNEMQLYFAINDAREIINDMGFAEFFRVLFKEKTGRELTDEERQAMLKLAEGWEL